MRRKWVFTAFLLFAVLIITLAVFSEIRTGKAEMHDETELEVTNAVNYRVLDSYGTPGHPKFSEIINTENIFSRYDSLLEEFNQAEKFRYIEVYDSLIQYDGFYENGETFVHGYESLPDDWDIQEFINQDIKLEGGRHTFLTNIKGAFISEKAFYEDYSLQNHIYSGQAFAAPDFAYNNGKVNVLMGYDYLDLYNIGDEISVLYLGYPVKLKIIGFLDDTSRIDLGNMNIPLNRYILLPSFNIDYENSEVNQNFSTIHYSKKTRGFFRVINDEIEGALAEFKEIIKKSELDYVYVPQV